MCNKTCGQCKNCIPLDICDGDCECTAKSDDKITIEVSEDDNIEFYGENDEPCEDFEPKEKSQNMKITVGDLKSILDKIEDNVQVTINGKSPKTIQLNVEYKRYASFTEKLLGGIAKYFNSESPEPGKSIASGTLDLTTDDDDKPNK